MDWKIGPIRDSKFQYVDVTPKKERRTEQKEMVYLGVEPKQPHGKQRSEAELKTQEVAKLDSFCDKQEQRGVTKYRVPPELIRNQERHISKQISICSKTHQTICPNGKITREDIAAYYGQAHGDA